MALPTAMTIFNRSMVNIENEIGVLKSFMLHERVVSRLKSNVKFFDEGIVKSSEAHISEFFKDYDFKLNIDTDTINKSISYSLNFINGKLLINKFDNNGDILKSYKFSSFNTRNSSHDLPFDIQVRDIIDGELNKKIIIYPFADTVDFFRSNIGVNSTGRESDQLLLTLNYLNSKISDEYLNTLIDEFDKDGIVDRQLEYKRTIDFVDSRSDFLIKELESIEIQKQEFKESNNLTDIKSDASVNISQKFTYNSELFKSQSQLNLVELLSDFVNENQFKMMPINIGIENSDINELIVEYNNTIKERGRLLMSAGPKNTYVKSIDNYLDELKNNIYLSIEKYDESLRKIILSLKSKEEEFSSIYQNIPENEKVLRSIERELEVKEALFILLLQKRERKHPLILLLLSPLLK